MLARRRDGTGLKGGPRSVEARNRAGEVEVYRILVLTAEGSGYDLGQVSQVVRYSR